MVEQTDFERAMALFQCEMKKILGNEAAWADESTRESSERLRWPLPIPTKEGEKLRWFFAVSAFELVMDSIEQAEGKQAVPTDVNSPRFQLILRMIRRAVEASLDAGREELGVGRITGLREFKNKMKLQVVNEALKSGQGVKGSGVSKSAAYRALQRVKLKS